MNAPPRGRILFLFVRRGTESWWKRLQHVCYSRRSDRNFAIGLFKNVIEVLLLTAQLYCNCLNILLCPIYISDRSWNSWYKDTLFLCCKFICCGFFSSATKKTHWEKRYEIFTAIFVRVRKSSVITLTVPRAESRVAAPVFHVNISQFLLHF